MRDALFGLAFVFGVMVVVGGVALAGFWMLTRIVRRLEDEDARRASRAPELPDALIGLGLVLAAARLFKHLGIKPERPGR